MQPVMSCRNRQSLRPVTRRFPVAALAAAATLTLFQATASAEPIRLSLPIGCDPGKTCWIVNYVDHDPDAGVRDYMCGTATYDYPAGGGHEGTDFAIRDRGVMARGVPVLTAAAGTVIATRDGMDDREIGERTKTDGPDGRACGNGVVISHGDGWETQYCHLRRGSVAVRPDQKVEPGQKIGQVGLSGYTEFPHLHLSVRKDGKTVDPFVGEDRTKRCGPGPDPLWARQTLDRLPYRPTAIYNVGFAPEKPLIARVRNGEYGNGTVAPKSPALVLWAEFFNVRAGDRITLRIVTPAGDALIDYGQTLEKDQARRYVFAGKPLKTSTWPQGGYRGEVTLTRRAEDGKQTPLRETRELIVKE